MLSAVWVTEDCYCCCCRRSSHLHGSCASLDEWKFFFLHREALQSLFYPEPNWNEIHCSCFRTDVDCDRAHFTSWSQATHARDLLCLFLLALPRQAMFQTHLLTFLDCASCAATMLPPSQPTAIRFLLITIIYSKTKRKRRTIVASGLLRLIGHFRHRCDGADPIGLAWVGDRLVVRERTSEIS